MKDKKRAIPEVNCEEYIKVEHKETMSIYYRCLNAWKVEVVDIINNTVKFVCLEHSCNKY